MRQRVSPKTPHPQGARSAGKNATLENLAHFPALPIVTRRAKTTGLVRAAHRAGCPQGSGQTVILSENTMEKCRRWQLQWGKSRHCGHLRFRVDLSKHDIRFGSSR